MSNIYGDTPFLNRLVIQSFNHMNLLCPDPVYDVVGFRNPALEGRPLKQAQSSCHAVGVSRTNY